MFCVGLLGVELAYLVVGLDVRSRGSERDDLPIGFWSTISTGRGRGVALSPSKSPGREPVSSS